MSLSPVTRLGHYDVTALLGEGGMGQVWQVTDTQLNRQVALKILPDAFAADPDRLARFTREAQILASLNHPNIAQIHGIAKSDDTQALVLELVEGATLADRIAQGPIPKAASSRHQPPTSDPALRSSAKTTCSSSPFRNRRKPTMRNKRVLLAATAVIGALALSGLSVVAQQQDEEPPPMGFFITSVGIGDGANTGGLDGADAHCQALAAAAGAGNRTWRAYLSTQEPRAVNARDRIGEGPWANADGLVMATSVENLHYDNSNFNWTHTLDENGNQFASRIDGDPDFSEHDVLTGSQIDGTAFPAGEDRTCGNWTSNDEGSAMLGHADRYSFTTPGSPWNNAHPSRGCSQDNLVATGGAGLFYCFAID